MGLIAKIILKFIFLFPMWAGKIQYPIIPQTPNYEIVSDSLYEHGNKYQKDFLFLCYAIEDTHPNPYWSFGKEIFQKKKDSIYNVLADCPGKAKFALAVQPFMAGIKDGHTGLSTLNTIWSYRKIYPVMYSWFGNDLYVTSISKKHVDHKILGQQVVKFNGYPVKEVYDKLKIHSSNDNEIGEKQDMAIHFILADFLKATNIVDKKMRLDIECANGDVYQIKPIHGIDLDFEHLTTTKNESSEEKPGNNYIILDSIKTCYFQFNTMLPYTMRKSFTSILAEIFNKINKQGVENLIVDLRYNGGGNSNFGEQLLYLLDVPIERKDFTSTTRISDLLKLSYPENISELDSLYYAKNGKHLENNCYHNIWSGLREKPKYISTDPESSFFVPDSIPHFNGNVVFITGRDTYSSANFLATIVKDNGLFPVIGEVNKQKPTSFGDKIMVKLPNTGLAASISFKYFERPNKSKNKDDYMYPDYPVEYTYEDFINGVDPFLEKAFDVLNVSNQ